jgi:putative transposase
VGILTAERGLGVTRACGLVGISRSLYRYRSRLAPALELRNRIAELAAQKRRYGYRRIQVLLRREGWSVNHKRTYRLYREQGLAVRKRKRKRIGIAERLPLPVPSGPNQSWSIDYVADGLIDGRKLRLLAITEKPRIFNPGLHFDSVLNRGAPQANANETTKTGIEKRQR